MERCPEILRPVPHPEAVTHAGGFAVLAAGISARTEEGRSYQAALASAATLNTRRIC